MSITISTLSYRHPNKERLFEQISFTINKGEKAALVGNNGAGKSTLLQLIAGISQPSTGNIFTSSAPWYVPQHLGQYNSLTIAAALKVDHKLAAIKAITEGSIDEQHFNNLEDDWEIEDKVREALSKWQLGHLLPKQQMADLSGGEKTKVFLAGIDIHAPEIILLDEPSNHLDVRSREQLYELISNIKATLLAVSHDRTLLNLLAETFELSPFGIEVYGGNFDFYREQKEGKLNALENDLHEQSKTLKQTRQKARDVTEKRQKIESRGQAKGKSGSLPRIIAGGLKSKAEGSTAKALDVQDEKLSAISDNIRNIRGQIQQYQVLKIDIGPSDLHQGKVLVDATDLTYDFGNGPLWQPLIFQIRSGGRVHIKGNNGAGKTTLLKLITGMLTASLGSIRRADFTYLYLDQEYRIINPDRTVYEQLQHYNSRNLQEHELKSLLIYAQFERQAWDKNCGVLSGGEKMKLSLCCLSVSNHTPDILILDEPTNNLDVKSLEVLTSTIKDFNGTLLVISHDRYFTEEIGLDQTIEIKRIL
ncbi:ABC-F family ATP-binding cassette domain-containing protein [Mucilaginibacter sp. AK015]|uniref:ABC-F family ATP-binding cassette domain-containing protein n=1 Tax=Mucilaginibacter sp. AK015 TaxID=2723072 RepID=UPI00161A54A5|nr:ABC-F family ATP-binding cassette domain-containing protein [Mucilaginibacter sp. AK015]MBB5395254.1 ATPase subunit of ABC transporter with duplicated ATPase domains [Mucilaginibacter sp. AK015]